MTLQNSTSDKRPQLITVFAVLSLIGIGLALIFAVAPDNIFNGEGATASPPRDPSFQVLDVILGLIKLVGVIFILRMTKLGFYLYAAAEIAVAGMLLYQAKLSIDFYDTMIFSEDVPMDPAVFIVVFTAILIIGSILWVSVYASELKNMT